MDEGTFRTSDGKNFSEIDTRTAFAALQVCQEELPLPYGYCAVSLYNHSCLPARSSSFTNGVDALITRYATDALHVGLETISPLIRVNCCRYTSLLALAHDEVNIWGNCKQQCDTTHLNMSANDLVDLVNRAYVQDLRSTWIPLALHVILILFIFM